MLHRHVLGYVPASVVPAVVAFATIYLFTRLLSQAEFGTYALVTAIGFLCQLTVFSWLQIGATRFVARAAEDATHASLSAAIYRAFLVCAALLTAIYALVVLVAPLPEHLHGVIWLGLPLAIFRSLTSVNQGFHRGALRVGRYSFIECGQALLGLALGLLFVRGFGFGAAGLVLGLVIGAGTMALLDLPSIVRGVRAAPDHGQLPALMRYGLPMTASTALDYVMSTSDRLLMETFLGPAAVGVYASAYGTVDRAVTSVFTALSIATFPLAVRAFEHHGPEAARRQLYKNGTLVLAVTVPACAGLLVGNRHVASVLIGEAFRQQAIAIMPWIVVSSFLSGLYQHYLVHVFHLTSRTQFFIVNNLPGAILNVVLNIVLLPRVGVMGAVYATLASYLVVVAMSLVFGPRVFRMPYPWGPAFKVAVATGAMVGVLWLARFPTTAYGLAALVVVGALTYAAAGLLLDLGGARTFLLARFQARRGEGGKGP